MFARLFPILILTCVGLANTDAGAQSDLLVLTSDFQTGSISLVTGDQGVDKNLLTIHSDAVARYRKGKIYIVNRLGQDNILVLDRDDLSSPLIQFSVGNGTNPQDIVFAGDDKAYVSRLNSTSMLVVDPSDGSQIGEIDLSTFADADGLPEMGHMVTVGSRLYVVLQRLDRDGGFVPVAPSYIAVIDMATDTLVDIDSDADGVQAIRLSATNPSSLSAVGMALYVSLTSSFGDTEGGVEVIDLPAMTSRGLRAREADLGGDLTWVSMVSASRGFAIVSDASFRNLIVPFDVDAGTIGQPLSGHSGGFTPSLAVDGGRLIVPDRGTFEQPQSAGLLIYNTDGQLVDGPIDVGLPPNNIVVLSDAVPVTAVEEDARTGSVVPEAPELAPAFPNPFNGETSIFFSVGGHVPVAASLNVYDILGRRVRTLEQALLQAGRYRTTWRGRDDAGRQVASGAYVVELRVPGARVTSKVTYLK